MPRAPGTYFLYNSGAAYMLGSLVQRVTGMTVEEYLRPRQFDSLDIGAEIWGQSEEGVNLTDGGLSIRTEDGYRADGSLGQFSFVLPQQDIVLAITASSACFPNSSRPTLGHEVQPSMLVGSHPESGCDMAWLVRCCIGVTAAPVTRSSFGSPRTSASPENARGPRSEGAIAIAQRQARHGSCSRALRLSGVAARGRARLSAASGGGRSRSRGARALGELTSPVRAQRAAREHELGGGRRAQRDGWGHLNARRGRDFDPGVGR